MNKLVIENNYSWLQSEDEEIKNLLWKSLRFRTKNYFHDFRFKAKIWDGFNDYFKKDNGRFLTGLLPEVRMALRIKQTPYETIDNRNQIVWNVPKIDKYFLNEGPSPVKELRDYQVEYVNQSIKYGRGLITSPTGSGKSNAMKAIIKALPPKTPTLILANKTSLVDQNYEGIKSLGLDNVGRLYGKKKEPNYITCATSQSAHLLKPILGKIRVLIVDEVHEMLSKVPKRIYAALKNCPVRIGMSATAFKFDGKDECQKYEAKGWFGPPFLVSSAENGKLTTKELQNRGILSKADCTFYKVKEPQIPYAVYIDAVTLGIAENDFFHKMVTELVKKLEGRTLIIVERIEHGDRLKALIPHALWIRGEDKLEIRKEVIEKLKSSEDIVAIATAGIFTSGIDVLVHQLINCSSGQAEHQIIQKMGRGLRKADDKQNLKYFDFLFEINDYLKKHSYKRIKVLEKEGHIVKILDWKNDE